MEDKRILYGSVATFVAILAVILFALYNEGVFLSKTYHNELLGYDLKIPRGYRLGEDYMRYLFDIDNRSLRLQRDSEFDPLKAELVVLTKQDISKEERLAELLPNSPNISLEQICDCVVLSPNLSPKAIVDMSLTKKLSAITTTQVGEITNTDGTKTAVLHQVLTSIDRNGNVVELDDKARETSHIYFPKPLSFNIDNKYATDYTLEVFGLNTSRFTTDKDTRFLQKLQDGISFND